MTNTERFHLHDVPAAAAAKSLQSCPTLCNPIDGSPPGSAVPGILQARTLEWVAISFSLRLVKFIETESRTVTSGAWGRGGELLFNRHKVSVSEGFPGSQQ